MARQKGIDQKIQVTKGFVTEFTPVAFPQEAAIDLDNVIIDPDGSVRRRPGIDLEQTAVLNTIAGGVVTSAQIEEMGMSTHLWEAVGNSGTLNIVVFQIGVTLQFYAQVGVLSKQLLGTIDLTPFAVNSAKLTNAKVQTASGLGDLYVVSEFMDPIRISYDGAAFTATKITIRIRDFEGLDDGLAIDERPKILTRRHYYNLRNQGWTDININKFVGLTSNPDLCAATALSGIVTAKPWPSNADQMIVGIVTDSNGDLTFNGEFIREGFTGNTPAPRGHFILEAFNQQFDDVLGCANTGFRVFDTRPEAVAFHQGRAFFTSANVQGRIGGVLYSQQLTVPDKEGNCFQEADPTADQINDLIDTDGGFLPMPGVGEIYKLVEVGTGIAVIASNGVWFITGADGNGLSATNIRLDHSSTIGALSASSVVQAEGGIFYFGIDGIIQGTVDELSILNMKNITQQVIQTFYINISAAARRDAEAVYIPEQRKIYWAYREAQAAEGTTSRSFDKFLILDFDVGGFYKYSIPQQAGTVFPEIVGLSFVKPLVEGTLTEVVTEIDGTVVTDTALEIVTVEREQDIGQRTELKMATLAFDIAADGYKATFATFHSRSFTDWLGVTTDKEGIPMTSFIEFAEFNMGAIHTKGKPTYVHSFYQKTSKNLESGGYYELPVLGCYPPVADVMLVIDNTGSQKQDEYFTVTLPAISNIIQRWLVGSYEGKLGATVITEVPYLLNSLTTNLELVQTNIEALPVPTGQTNIADAITLATAEIALNGTGGTPSFIVIITDGAPNFPNSITAYHEAEVAALAARDAGIRVVVFGVMGQDLSQQVGGGGG